MARIPYQPTDISEPAAVVDAIRARRGGDLFNLDRMLLHSPPFAAGWNAFLGNVRRELDVSPKLCELAICVVAIINGADYEYTHHLPGFIDAGASDDQVAALPTLGNQDADVSMFDPSERAVIALTREMSVNAAASDATFAAVNEVLPDPQHIVEIVGVIAAYNMVSRFLVTLGVEAE